MIRLGQLKRAATEAPAVRHVEIWGHLEENNRFLRRAAGACLVWAFAALALGSYGVLLALYRPLAFHVDASGHATPAGRLSEQLAPTEPEVRYLAKEFIKRYAALNSLTIEADLSAAWNLMTEELRAQQERMLADYKKEHREDFVAFVKQQGVQTLLEFDAKRTEVTSHDGKIFTVHLRGKAKTWPMSRVGEDATTSERLFESVVTLVRCPRTEVTPNGLLVAKVAHRFFVEEKPERTSGLKPLPKLEE